MGLTVGSTSQTVMPAGSQVGQTLPLLISNSTTYRAANGDLLYAVFVGGGALDLVTGDVRFSGKEIIQARYAARSQSGCRMNARIGSLKCFCFNSCGGGATSAGSKGTGSMNLTPFFL